MGHLRRATPSGNASLRVVELRLIVGTEIEVGDNEVGLVGVRSVKPCHRNLALERGSTHAA